STQIATTTTTTTTYGIPEISGPGGASTGRETEENDSTQMTLTGGTSTRAPNTPNGTSQTNSPWTSKGEEKGFSASTGRTETMQTTMTETKTTISNITDTHEICPATETEEKNSTQTTPTEVTTTEAPDSHTTSVGHGTEGSSGNWSTDLTSGRQETSHTTVTETNTTSSNVVHTNGPTSLESNNTQTQSNQATVTEENNFRQTTPAGATSTGTPHSHNGSSETSEGQAADGPPITQSTDLNSGKQETNHTTMTQTNTTRSNVGTNEGHKNQQKSIIISVLVGASAVTVFVGLLLRRSYFQKKTINDRNPENVYESIEDVRVAAKGDGDSGKEKLPEMVAGRNLERNQTQQGTHHHLANESQYEAIYVLAGDPAIVNLGKKTDTEPSSSSETPENQ
ncbi:roundabout 2-like, partial [Clarias magur]